MIRCALLRLLLLLFPLACSGFAQAHALAPALLQLSEQTNGRYAVLWRTSVSRAATGEVAPQWPSGCALPEPLDVQIKDEAIEARGTLVCDSAGLAGRSLAVSGLAGAGIGVILRVADADSRVQSSLLDASRSTWVVPARTSAAQIFADYFALGVGHLWGGLDHLLFVAGLVLILSGWRRLFWTLTAFTLGHSLTLAAASLGWITVDQRLTEWLIAASLLLLASEAARPDDRGWLRRFPAPLALGFGLVHGSGFAGALAEIGLPEGEIARALLAFNLGIEFGQVVLVAGVLLLVLALRRIRAESQTWLPLRIASTYGIGIAGAYWCFERSADYFA